MPVCELDHSGRTDAYTPTVEVSDWGPPVRLGDPVNTPCPQDAIEITADGQFLYVLNYEDVLQNLDPQVLLARYNNTYRFERTGGPGEFSGPEYFDLNNGSAGSFDGELTFVDSETFFFHSLRLTNTGYVTGESDDILDIYSAQLSATGRAQGIENVGTIVNSIYADGEQAYNRADNSLYFASDRPGQSAGTDIWKATRIDTAPGWTTPVNLGSPPNSSATDYQPAFTAAGNTMYFTSDRNPLLGVAIYRSVRDGDSWSDPELVISGLVGEASLTADGQLLYFVHVLSDAAGTYDVDVWYTQRQ